MRKIRNLLMFCRNIRVFQYIYLNYFCRMIVRKGKGKIIPYRNSIIDLERTSKIIIYDGNVEIGLNKLKGSKTETFLRLREKAIWNVKERCELSYGVTLEILNEGKLNSNYFTMNSFSVLIAAKEISLGNDVMIGRNVIIYDSDFHYIIREGNDEEIKSLPIKIGNHVWLTSNVVVLKGVCIGDNSVIASGSIITKSVGCNQIVGSEKRLVVLSDGIGWKR